MLHYKDSVGKGRFTGKKKGLKKSQSCVCTNKSLSVTLFSLALLLAVLFFQDAFSLSLSR